MGSAVEFGHVVIADIPDPDGNPCDHVHTAMVLRPPDEGGNLWLLAISSKFTRPIGRLMIEVPWANGGHSITGLDRPCVLKCAWAVPWHVDRVLRRIGNIPAQYAEQAVEYAITAIEEKKAQTAGRGPTTS